MTMAPGAPRTIDGTAACARISQLMYRHAGISLAEHKRYLIQSRLQKRLGKLGISLGAYAELVERDAAERGVCTDLLTTNHTAWMREPAHFVDFAERVLAGVAQRPSPRRLRVWCAAAASGEEPYSIALTIAKAMAVPAEWEVAILATDISSRALAKTRDAVYTEERIECLALADRQRYLRPTGTGTYRVGDELRRMVHPASLNLMGDWPMKGPFDVIFCRNVMIYFDRPTQERLVNRMANLLVPGGTLYVGHSESLSGIAHPLSTHGPAIYRK
jgi:chemotaxis protein methyltransferase CheR